MGGGGEVGRFFLDLPQRIGPGGAPMQDTENVKESKEPQWPGLTFI